MSAEDPVASPIGHGATGFRDNLRDWYQLSAQSERQPQTYVELRPGIVMTGWAPELSHGSLASYGATLAAQTWDSAAIDIVAVDTEKRRLVRTEGILACQALDGSYYHDADNALLHVNVDASEVPLVDAIDTAVIVARPGILIGTDTVTLPTLGPDLLVNGGFDDGGVAGWSIPIGLASTVATFDPAGNDRCLLLTSLSIGTPAAVRQDVTTVAGETYCLSGSYIVGPNGTRVTIADGGTGANIVGEDGRSYGAPTGQDLAVTSSVVSASSESERETRRRFCHYFIARTTSTRITLGALNGASAVYSKFDSLKLQRVYSWQRTHALLPSGGVPTLDDGREDMQWGRWRVGAASFRVNNDDGALGLLLGQYDFAGAEVVFRHGGRFPDSAEEITPEHLRVGFVGRVRDLELDEQGLMLRCEDTRGVALAVVPERKYTRTEFPDLDARYDDAPRPLAFGYCQDVPPVRIGTGTARDPVALGWYEVADAESATHGIVVEDSSRPARAWLYVDDGAAGRGDVGLRSDVSDHLTWDADAAQFTLAKCCKPVPLDGRFFSFDVGGAQIDVLLTPSQEEELTSVGTGLGGANNWGPGGSATDVLGGVAVLGDGAHASSISTTGKRRLEVTDDAISGSAAITYVELRAWLRVVDPYDPETFPVAYQKLYVDPGGTGTRYYADSYVENPANTTYVEVVFRWAQNPATSAYWTEAEVNALRRGVEFDSGPGGYLHCDLFQRKVGRISTSAPTAQSPGVRSPSQAATLLAAAMNAAASTSDITASYDESTQKFSAGKGAGTLNLLTETGRSPNGWAEWGFKTDTDETGALSYTAVEPYYRSPDDIDTPVLRVDFLGSADDASGTYTGTAGAAVERGPDVIRYLLQERLRVPADQIILGSFSAVRAARAGVISLYLWQPTSFDSLVGIIEAHDRADLVIDGQAYRYDVRPTELGAYSPLLADREILSLSMRLALEDVASSVRVAYAPGSQVGRGTMPAVEGAVVGVRALYGSADKLELVCASATEADAEALRVAIAATVARAQRVVELSAYGDVTALRVGEVFGLRATAGVIADSAGSLDVDMRVVRRRVNAETMTVQITAVELPQITPTSTAADAAPWRAPWTPHLWAPWHHGPGHMRRIRS